MGPQPDLKMLIGGLVGLLWARSAQAADALRPAANVRAAETAEAPKSESHLSELFYVNAELGTEYVGLETLHLNTELVPSTANKADIGPVVGVGAGLRLAFLTLGPRFRFGEFRDWDLWTIGAEVGFRAPLGKFEPWLSLGAGFAKVGHLQDSRVQVSGYDGRLGAGLDYYFADHFSIGGAATAEILGLARPGVNLNRSTGSVNDDLLKLDGSAMGFGVAGAVVLGAHL
jgi:hypothetical protein